MTCIDYRYGELKRYLLDPSIKVIPCADLAARKKVMTALREFGIKYEKNVQGHRVPTYDVTKL